MKQERRSSRKKRALQIGIGLPLLVVLAFVLIWLVGRGDDDDTITTASSTTADGGDTPCPPAEGAAERVGSFDRPPSQCIDPTKTYTAEVVTDHGAFTIELATAESPINVNNFVVLSRYRYYEGTSCHRILTDFVVQCGRPGDDENAPGYTVPDELPAAGSYAEGVVAMANKSTPNTAGGQFFVITGDQGASLPPEYTILGRVVEGYDTTIAALEALAGDPVTNGTPTLEPISIESVTITESDPDDAADQSTTTLSSDDTSTASSPS